MSGQIDSFLFFVVFSLSEFAAKKDLESNFSLYIQKELTYWIQS